MPDLHDPEERVKRLEEAQRERVNASFKLDGFLYPLALVAGLYALLYLIFG